MNNKDSASRLFEQLYDPNNLHINQEEKREKNIQEINMIAEDLEKAKVDIYNRKIKELHDIEKIQMDEKEKERVRLEAEKKYVTELSEKQFFYMQTLKETINKQAKTMLILKNNDQINDFYNQVVNNPLSGNLHQIEMDVYREFLLAHPEIEKIIIAYSELENQKHM